MCLSQINQFFSEVSGFVRSCCDQLSGHEMHEEGCIALEDQVAQSCLLEKGTKLRVIIGNPPSNYHEDLFSQFKAECKNQMLLVSSGYTLQSIPLAAESVKLKNVDTEAKLYVILVFAILNATIWCNFEKKNIWSSSVHCSVDQNLLEKSVIASIFHTGLHKGTISLWKKRCHMSF